MRIAIATDAWSPQINGVVTTLQHTRDELVRQGHEVCMITPEGRRSIPCPTYPEIRLTLFAGVKSIGGLQTSILGLAELLVTIGLAHIWLRESLSWQQWIGAGLLMAALLLVRRERRPQISGVTRGWLYWLRPPLGSSHHPDTQDRQEEQSL